MLIVSKIPFHRQDSVLAWLSSDRGEDGKRTAAAAAAAGEIGSGSDTWRCKEPQSVSLPPWPAGCFLLSGGRGAGRAPRAAFVWKVWRNPRSLRRPPRRPVMTAAPCSTRATWRHRKPTVLYHWRTGVRRSGRRHTGARRETGALTSCTVPSCYADRPQVTRARSGDPFRPRMEGRGGKERVQRGRPRHPAPGEITRTPLSGAELAASDANHARKRPCRRPASTQIVR